MERRSKERSGRFWLICFWGGIFLVLVCGVLMYRAGDQPIARHLGELWGIALGTLFIGMGISGPREEVSPLMRCAMIAVLLVYILLGALIVASRVIQATPAP